MNNNNQNPLWDFSIQWTLFVSTAKPGRWESSCPQKSYLENETKNNQSDLRHGKKELQWYSLGTPKPIISDPKSVFGFVFFIFLHLSTYLFFFFSFELVWVGYSLINKPSEMSVLWSFQWKENHSPKVRNKSQKQNPTNEPPVAMTQFGWKPSISRFSS